MSLLTSKQKRAIRRGYGKHSTCRQLEKKEIAEITDSFRTEGTHEKRAIIDLTEKGSDIRRKLEDPTIDT